MKRMLGSALLLVAACKGGSGGSDDEHTVTRVPVSVATVRRDTIAEAITAVGRVTPVPGGAATLTAAATGVVGSLHVQVGSLVHAGDAMIELEVPELAADLAAKQAAADAAAREAERLDGLLKDGIASRRAAEEAKGAAASAAAALTAAKTLEARTHVRSPIAGGVARVAVRPGERVEAGAVLVEVVSADTVDVVAAIAPAVLARLRRHLPAEVVSDPADTPRRGWIEALSPSVDTLSGAGTMVVRVPNPGAHLLPGASASVAVTLGVTHDALLVPETAVVLQGDSAAVFVVQADSSVKERAVELGARSGGRVQVTGDIKAGDLVVTTGAFGLADGMHVVPKSALVPKDTK
ncbi:MAG TPA: efflux RND transporter periplasmic adaptor subunit [Gemmatimonadales bacterium]|jgi:RND family efflux transporter MFP subunit